ncbi:hypothetical protein Bhyg_10255 [Pseudolycoriella hygida]|uniref:Uncharacterized protein n=1 Tax=Pseudolycoriella hygida TaxID=35572 RepID=A0A9Q0MUW0_9DIPT|nr:hypothetical protein Bhyg_10255 [Pseudolycoriella hygida]
MLLAVAMAAPGLMDNQVESDNSIVTKIFQSCSESGDLATCLAVKGITDASGKTGRLFDLAMDSISNFFSSHNLEVKFPEETTTDIARAIEEGRGKIKKIAAPIILAIGAKVIALIPIFLGGLILLATKALVVAKIAFILASVLGFQKLSGVGGSGFNLLSKFSGAGNSAAPQWANSAPAWSNGAATQGWSSGSANSYPYARSYDAQDMAYSEQIPSSS